MAKDAVVDTKRTNEESSKAKKRSSSNRQAEGSSSPKLKEGKKKDERRKEEGDKENKRPKSPELVPLQGELTWESEDDDDDFVDEGFKTPQQKKPKMDPQAPRKLR